MIYHVYMIGTFDKNNNLITYVGYTNNLNQRLYLHNNSKGAKFTRGRNWKLIFKKKFFNKKSAMQFEYMLKKNRLNRNILKNKFLYEKN
jgi:putative endonuclease